MTTEDKLAQALRSVRGDINIARACLMDSVETHGTHGGWLHEEARRLDQAQDECDAALAEYDSAQASKASGDSTERFGSRLTDEDICRIAETLPREPGEDYPAWGSNYYRADEHGRFTIPSLPANLLPFARALLAAADPTERQGQKPEAVVHGEWLPIETAPDDTDGLVAVRWLNEEGDECLDLDHKEDGCWQGWHDHAEHVEVIGGHGVSYTPPYVHWARLPSPPQAATDGGAR